MLDIHEPATTITDLILALECAALASLCLRADAGVAWRHWSALFFAATALAALAGAIAHGWLYDGTSLSGKIVWRGTLLALGFAALGAWGLGTLGVRDPVAASRIRMGALIALMIYSSVVLTGTDSFAVAVIFYLPSALFLLIVLIRRVDPRARIGVAGLMLMFIGAGLQQAGVAPHPPHFDHNVLYHLIQMVALPLLLRGLQVLRDQNDEAGH
jgi:hypothetical protein